MDDGSSAVETSTRNTARIGAGLVALMMIVASVMLLTALDADIATGGLAPVLKRLASAALPGLFGVRFGYLAWTGRIESIDLKIQNKSRGRQHRVESFPPASSEFNLATARAAAVEWDLESWVHRYLNGPGRNPEFSEGLWQHPRYWRGPLLVLLHSLTRTCGPEEGMEFRVSRGDWDRRVAELQSSFDSIEAWPPLIVQYESGRLFVRDGNHRCGALSALGIDRVWIILWYAGEIAWRHHADRRFSLGSAIQPGPLLSASTTNPSQSTP